MAHHRGSFLRFVGLILLISVLAFYLSNKGVAIAPLTKALQSPTTV